MHDGQGGMSEQTTIVSLAQGGNGLTDWDRLARMSDADVDASIACDDDTFVPADSELGVQVLSSRTRCRIRRRRDGRFSWSVVEGNGTVLAEDRRGAMTRSKARNAALLARRVLMHAAS